VRFSQEVAEDWQLIFTERAAHTFVGTNDGHPYVAPFSGNIVELCPVGALTSQPYRFRARPWDIESAGGICTLCPSQCNVTFTVRDEKVLRVLARDHHEVDDGWLCDKGRFAYQAIHVDERITAPMVREGGFLREVSWEHALGSAAALGHHKGRVGALVGGQATNEEGFLLARLLREGLDSSDIDSRSGAPVGLQTARALAAPALQANVPDLEFAHTVLLLGCEPLDDAPILDLRIRKGVRRNGVKLAIASARPSALDRNATVCVRYVPGEEAAFLLALEAAMATATSSGVARSERGDAGAPAQDLAELAALLRDGGEDVVIVWGERLDPAALPSLLAIAQTLGLAARDGAGLLEIPAGCNGRGLREAGALPNAGPGYGDPAGAAAGRSAAEIARAAADGELHALYLLQVDPVRELPDRTLWNRALQRAGLVIAHASVLTEGLREHADIIFPAESGAEKEGTIVHPDGRLQRLRSAIKHPHQVRAGWAVIAEVAKRNGLDLGVLTSGMAFQQLVEAVPFYAGLTLDEIGGRGVRWPARAQAGALPPAKAQPAASQPAKRLAAQTNGALRLGTYRPIWAAPEVEVSPALHYTVAEQRLELSPVDAARLGILDGERVEVAQLDDSGAAQSGEAGRRAGAVPEGMRLHATAAVRTGVIDGTAFLADGLAADSANALTEPLVEVKPA
jgi:NADH-quinone oxidoreductase subunit G